MIFSKTDIGFALVYAATWLSDFANTLEGRVTTWVSLGLGVFFAGIKIYDLIKSRAADGKIDADDMAEIIDKIQTEVSNIKDKVNKK